MIYKGKVEEQKIKSYFDLKQLKTSTFTQHLSSLKKLHGSKPCLSYFNGDWQTKTYDQFLERVTRIAQFMVKKNLQKKHVAILSESRPEVVELLYASFCANTKTTPIDVKLAPQEIAYILNDIKPALIYVSSKQLSVLKETQKLLHENLNVITIDECERFYSLSDITQHKQDDRELTDDPQATSLIIYTSGSTGHMKGVEICGHQILFQIDSLSKVGLAAREDRNLSMLPMNHIFEISTLFASIACGLHICVSHSLEKQDLGMCFQQHHPTQLFTVPLFCKSIMNGILMAIEEESFMKKTVFRLLCFLGRTLPYQGLRRKLFKPVHEKFGGQLSRIITGGAAIDPATVNFFKMLGIDVYEGYGLTETAPVIAVNRTYDWSLGSVGPLLPGVEVKIDRENGEILTRGPHVMKGYFGLEEMTKEVLDHEGWFRTGDVGHINNREHLCVTGRSKNLIVLESGKKVHPEEVEKVLCEIDFIKELAVFGDKVTGSSNSQNVVMVATVDDQLIAQNDEQKIIKLLQDEVVNKSSLLADYKVPTIIKLSKDSLPSTSSMKVKHYQVAKLYEEGKFL